MNRRFEPLGVELLNQHGQTPPQVSSSEPQNRGECLVDNGHDQADPQHNHHRAHENVEIRKRPPGCLDAHARLMIGEPENVDCQLATVGAVNALLIRRVVAHQAQQFVAGHECESLRMIRPDAERY
jgi:hypothetical protein